MKAMLAEDWNAKTPLLTYIDNSGSVFEQKLDGHRVLLNIQNRIVTAYGRNGQVSQHNPMIQETEWLSNFKHFENRHVILDGELIDKTFYVFDAPKIEGLIEPHDPHMTRKYAIDAMFNAKIFNSHLQLVNTARTKEEKIKLTLECRNKGAEGVMIKETSAPYIEGRSSSLLKVKFIKSADVVVTKTNSDGKTNASLGAHNEHGELIEIGRCSLIGKEDIETGDVVEIRYLYISDKNRLVQPRIKFKRQDKQAKECTLDQFPIEDTKLVVTSW